MGKGRNGLSWDGTGVVNVAGKGSGGGVLSWDRIGGNG